jgi:hypothetical protein
MALPVMPRVPGKMTLNLLQFPPIPQESGPMNRSASNAGRQHGYKTVRRLWERGLIEPVYRPDPGEAPSRGTPFRLTDNGEEALNRGSTENVSRGADFVSVGLSDDV